MERSCTAGKPIKCKAAVCRGAGQPLVIEEIEVAAPKGYEVRIKIVCTSLCHSDVTFWKMEGPLAFFPRIFGHEAVGIVESVGREVEEVKEGDTVVPVFLAHCQECVDCKSETSNLCSKLKFRANPPGMPRDGSSVFKDSKGEVVHNFLSVSSFTEYTVVDVGHVVKITGEIPPEKACLLGCGVSTGIGAAWKVGKVEKGSSVAVFGLGAVGLAVAQGARLRGASKIIGVDLNPEKFEAGKKLGVTHFVNPGDCGEKPISEVIKEMTDGGADYCFECIGLASVMSDAFTSSRPGWGKTVILGVEMHGAPLNLSTFELLMGKTLMGSLFGGIKPKTDVPLLVQRYLDKELQVDEFITHELGFEDINKAFDLLGRGKTAVCRGPGQPLVIEEIEVAAPKRYEVRIKIICTSLCHSDVTFWKIGDSSGFFPRIFGHEATGIVESVGEEVEEMKEGDTVVPVFLGHCRECVDCKSEASNICSTLKFKANPPGMPRDGSSVFKDSKGEVVHNFLNVSSFSEYTVVDVGHLVKIPGEIPPEKACLLSCGVSTGLGAAWKVGKVEKGSSVAVFGLGAVGLAVAEGARIRGASKIIGVDLNPEKFEFGKKLGVTHFVNPRDCGEKPIGEVIKEMTDGGADICFECIGLASVMRDAFASSRPGWGKTVILGVEMHGAPLNLSSVELLLGKTLMGSLFGGIKPKTDVPLLVQRYLDKELQVDEFITHEVRFEDINKAFDLLREGKSLRCVIWLDN
ncbi:hypothetical protein H6P81_011395 [Aristolochia fimbriata]|uniref:Enoyl reductase (ER) domain-containing protein n=1 Tax=Aristolochia fimbriata TaxID=158543 RepID=A0AAV7ERD0_ARIFI|nr:hypothetical protein H6P81_011395 [Aristolochia fimbriata]